MKHKIFYFLAAALFSSASLAATTQQPDHSNQFFAGAGVGYGISNFTSSDLDEVMNNPALTSGRNRTTTISSKDGAYYTAEFGYMLTQRYGLDFEYLKKVTKPSFAFTNAARQQGNGTFNYDMYILSLLANFSLNKNISIVPQAGYVYSTSELKFNSQGATMTGIKKQRAQVSGPMIGLGTNYNLATNLVLVVEYKHIFENKNNIKTDTVTVSESSGIASPSVDLVDAGIRYYF